MATPDPEAELDRIHRALMALAAAESRRPVRLAIQAAAGLVLDAMALGREGTGANNSRQ